MKNALVALCCLALTACGGPPGAVIAGNGVAKEQVRPLANFTKVQVENGLPVEVKAGRAFEVKVAADENLHSYVQATVVAGQLIVNLSSGVGLLQSRSELKVTVSLPTLQGVEASGGSRLKVFDATGDLTRLHGSGGSSFTFEGGAGRTLRLELSGGSSLTAPDFALDELDVDLSGGSNGRARVKSKVSGNLSGGSVLEVIGHPASSVEASGGSRLTFKDS